MKEKALKLFKEGMKKLGKPEERVRKPEENEAAISLFEKALAIDSSSSDIWFHKGRAHVHLGQYAEAMVAFDRALVIDSPTLPNGAINLELFLKNPKLRRIMIEQGPLLRSNANLPLSLGINWYKHFLDVICKPDYLLELAQLKKQHQSIGQMSFQDQIQWIIRLMEFQEKYYQNDASAYPFVENEMVERNPKGQKRRLTAFGNRLERLYRLPMCVKAEHIGFTTQFDPYFLELIAKATQDIFFEDATIVLRMLFESIHHLPREQRANLVAHLPWGPNSWHFLEFLGALFIGDEKFENEERHGALASLVPLFDTAEVNTALTEYFHALTDYLCMVKIGLLHFLKSDMQQLKNLFTALANHLTRSSDLSQFSEDNKIKALSDMKTLLWYFKHLFNFTNLLALLPFNVAGDPLEDKFKKSTNQRSVYNQLLLHNFKSTDFSRLKNRLSFLRRIQMVGEFFTKRNLGNELEKICFVDFVQLEGVRNGMSHYEDLPNPDVLGEFETSSARMHVLYSEYEKLRSKVVLHIAEWQRPFGHWPNAQLGIITVEKELNQYWHAVKGYYQDPIPVVKPIQPRLANDKNDNSETELEFFLSAFKPDSAQDARVIQVTHLVMGKEMTLAEMKNITMKELEPLLKDDFLADRVKKQRFLALLTKAKDALKDEKKASAPRPNTDKQLKIAKRREAMAQDFPEIDRFGNTMHAELAQQDSAALPISVIAERLQNRYQLLIDLLKEENIEINPQNLQVLDLPSLLQNDHQLLLSCSYLTAQLISTLNKMSSLGAFESLNPELDKAIQRFVTLRNTLEHSDPILETAIVSSYNMMNEIPNAIAGFIQELVINHGHFIMNLNRDSLTANKARGERVKQDTPLDIDSFPHGANLFTLFSYSPPPANPTSTRSVSTTMFPNANSDAND